MEVDAFALTWWLPSFGNIFVSLLVFGIAKGHYEQVSLMMFFLLWIATILIAAICGVIGSIAGFLLSARCVGAWIGGFIFALGIDLVAIWVLRFWGK